MAHIRAMQEATDKGELQIKCWRMKEEDTLKKW